MRPKSSGRAVHKLALGAGRIKERLESVSQPLALAASGDMSPDLRGITKPLHPGLQLAGRAGSRVPVPAPRCVHVITDRKEAGLKLAQALAKYKSESPVVLAVPRGGVPVGYEVARALDAPLDIIVARKLGAPGEPELGLGAVVDGDHPESVLNQDLVALLGVSQRYLRTEIESQLREIRRRQETYRKGRPAVEVRGRTVIVVDDGIATGGSIRAALRGVRRLCPKKVVLAVPVAPHETIEALGRAPE